VANKAAGQPYLKVLVLGFTVPCSSSPSSKGFGEKVKKETKRSWNGETITKADARNVSYRDATMENVLARDCSADSCDFSRSSWKRCDLERYAFNKCEFFGADFLGPTASIVQSQLSRCGADDTRFSDIRIEKTQIKDSSMICVRLTNAKIENTMFFNCDLRGALFSGVSFKSVCFNQCKMELTSFTGCSFRAASFLNCLAGARGGIYHGCSTEHAFHVEGNLPIRKVVSNDVFKSTRRGHLISAGQLTRKALAVADSSAVSNVVHRPVAGFVAPQTTRKRTQWSTNVFNDKAHLICSRSLGSRKKKQEAKV